jgi:hypothetical protein
MSRGIVLFGVNNANVDYIQIAVMAAAFIKKNMPGIDICLITDQPSKLHHDNMGRWPLVDFFSHVKILPDVGDAFENRRIYKDTRYHCIEDHFRNETRSLVYDLSPFDETLLLDTDYLICNDVLNCVWGGDEEIMMNKQAISLLHTPLTGAEFRLNAFGIKMYWATAVYFKKGNKAKLLFSLVEHIKDNWEFYKLTYEFPGSLFRNDYAFSIAIHILNGFSEEGNYTTPLPDDTILSALDTDQFFRINSPTDLSFFANSPDETWKFYVTRTKGLNVHCMNKLSLLNNMESIMEILHE